MGSDTSEKQELDSAILNKADRVIVDSIPQSLLRGEVYKALEAGAIKKDRLVELGTAIANQKFQRQSDEETTVVDLTGVAVQDIQISKAVWKVVAPKR
jgi:ornithine cyclodeaminase